MILEPEIIAKKLDGYSITTGDVMDASHVGLALTSDERLALDPEDRHSYLAMLTNQRVILVESTFPITSQTALRDVGDLISLSAGGSVRRSSLPPRGGDNEPLVGDASGKKVYGRTRLTEVASIAGQAYAVGTRRAAYRRQAPGVWDCIDDGCYVADDFDAGFNAIDGYGLDEVYAVGERGEIWQHDGASWTAIASPTDQALNTVTCAPDGTVYAAGAKGVIVAGRGSRWTVIDDVPKGLEFWGSAWYDDALHLTANLRSAHRLDPVQGLQTVDFGECATPMTAYHLKAREGALWLFGPKDIRRYADGAWTDIVTLG